MLKSQLCFAGINYILNRFSCIFLFFKKQTSRAQENSFKDIFKNLTDPKRFKISEHPHNIVRPNCLFGSVSKNKDAVGQVYLSGDLLTLLFCPPLSPEWSGELSCLLSPLRLPEKLISSYRGAEGRPGDTAPRPFKASSSEMGSNPGGTESVLWGKR